MLVIGRWGARFPCLIKYYALAAEDENIVFSPKPVPVI